MFKGLREKYFKKGWRKQFHNFYFGIKPEETKETGIVVKTEKVEANRVEEKVVIGKKYFLKTWEAMKSKDGKDSNPFRHRGKLGVKVIDIQDGFVLYQYNSAIPGSTLWDQSCSIEQFEYMYEGPIR